MLIHLTPPHPPTHPQVFAAGEDTLLAPLVAALQSDLARPGADEAALFEDYGKRYLTQMRARAPGGGTPKFVVDKMLVRPLDPG